MKKFISIILSIVLSLIFVGCIKEPDNTISQSISISQIESQEQSEAQNRLPSTVVATDINGLYKLETGIDEYSEAISASINDDVLRLEYITPGLDMCSEKVVLYSITDEKTIGEVTLPESMWITGNLNDGGFYAVALNTSEVIFYDRNGSETYRKTLDIGVIQSYAAISKDGKYMLYNSAPDAQLMLYDFSSGTAEKLGNESGIFDSIGYKDGFFYLRSSNGIFRIKPEQKKIEYIFDDGKTYFATPEYEIAQINSYLVVTPIQDTENSMMTSVNSDYEIPKAAREGMFVTCNYTDSSNFVRAYNIENSTISPELKITGDIQKTLFYNDFLIIFSVDTNSKAIYYYLYDLTETTEYKSIEFSQVDDAILYAEDIPEWTGDQETINLAQSILNKYGVRVLYGEDVMEQEMFSFTCNIANDNAIQPKMQALYNILEYFPTGMTQEIGNGHEVWIYLSGKIKYTGTENYVDGFATNFGIHPFIVIDTNCSDSYFKETMVHEMSHLIDNCLNVKWLDGWTGLLPESILEDAYFNSYQDASGKKNTPYDDEKSNVWFYNQYSRTFPTEDRAVIFQKMYLSYINGELTDEFAKYDNLSMKARYYCVMLRNNFESCKEADTLPWESLFGELDLNEFDIE